VSFFSGKVLSSITNSITVVGDQEMNGRQVNVRNRDDTSSQKQGKPVPLEEAIQKLKALRDTRGSDNPFPGEPAEAVVDTKV
jgi:threonyl-tRNA synthetase